MPIQTKWKSLQDFFGLHPVQIVSKETTLKSCVFGINRRIFQHPHKSFIVAQVEEEGSEKIASQKSKPYEVPRWKSSYVPSTETLRRERNKLDEEYVGKKSSFLLNFIHLLLLILFLLRVQAASSPPKTHIFIC